MNKLLEDKRQELISNSKHADNYAPENQFRGKNRYERRLHSRVANSVREMNSIDMNKFFQNNILDVDVKVRGETNDYIVRISFGEVLDQIHKQLAANNDVLNLRCVIRALVSSFNGENVYVRCSCPDFQYRFGYYLSVHDIIVGDKETRPSNITNPNDTKGRGCKHILLVLSNNSWLTKVASVIFNYIRYMEQHYPNMYADVIYPAIYQREYTGDVQLQLQPPEEKPEEGQPDISVSADKDLLNVANKWARTKTQFQKGNEYRFQKQNRPMKRQIDFDNLISDSENAE